MGGINFFYMNINYNEFLMIMFAILILLLIVQGLDYIFGFGVNTYWFIVFCIAFAFTLGSIYHNIKTSNNKKFEESVYITLNELQTILDGKIERKGMTRELNDCQEALTDLKKELGIE